MATGGNMRNFLKILIAGLLVFSFAAAAPQKGSFTDSRDGHKYKTVEIGDQTWMAENLNYKVNDGKQSWCYDKKKSNCEKYGRLYTWKAAQKVCPAGWHLPSLEEFGTLLEKDGSSEEAKSANLRAPSWEEGEDKYGFSALPAGGYRSSYKEFLSLGYDAYFWSSTEGSESYAYGLGIHDDNAYVLDSNKDNGYSVRCLKD